MSRNGYPKSASDIVASHMDGYVLYSGNVHLVEEY